jgi:membrane protein CcdC involved in cytochrome C biogenesis|nr:hypothetical protein [uncultured Macellibacteroides sp.]
MKINKDLVDAVLMLSVISLVLIGTTKFDDESSKTIVMAAVGFLAVIALVLRVLVSRNSSGNSEHSH